MKISISALIGLALVADSLQAQSPAAQSQIAVPAPTPYAIVDQDANSRVWQREEYEAGPNGEIITNIDSYIETATGLNYWRNGRYNVSDEQIAILPNGTATATNGQHQVFFPPNINSGQIVLITPDGTQVVSEPMEISYFDGTNTVVLAELTNSVGVLAGNNQVIYPNAFAGLKADLRYTYRKSSFEQDVILQQQPLTPEAYGLNPETSRLQIVTEFFNSPNPTAATTTLPEQAGITLVDQNIGFGRMQMGLGRAFLLGRGAAEPGAQVAKSWLSVDGMQFLVEEVPVNAIVNGLETLPLTALNGNPGKAAHLASRRVVVPRHKPEKASDAAVRFTRGRLPATGFCMDYQTINSSQTNYTFQSDTTYYISGVVNLFQTNTFEGGTVIKYATNGSITISGSAQSVICKGGPYRPVVFTAVDDNSVGVNIGSGTPLGYYGNPMLSLGSSLPVPTLTGVRFCYAQTAIQDLFVGGNIYDAQFVDCQNGLTIGGGALLVGNALFANTLTNVIFAQDGNASANIQNATMSGSTYLATAPASSQGVTIALTNCIVANVTNILAGSFLATNGNFNGSYNSGSCPSLGFVASPSLNPFQTVGSGYYYLTNSCGLFNVGTTNIDPKLLADIKIKTAYSPTVLTSAFTSSTNLFPQAQRDTNAAALGYHYDPLDYCWSALWCGIYGHSGTLFLTNGVAIGLYGASGFTGNMTSQGTPLQPNQLVRYSTVQEEPTNWGATMSGSLLGSGPLSLRFTDISFLSDASAARYLLSSGNGGNVIFRDCQFQTVYLNVNLATAAGISLTNNVFRRSYVYLGESGSGYFPVNMYNNLFLQGTVQLFMNDYHDSHYIWYIYNNLFVQSTNSLSIGAPGGPDTSNNGYYQASIFGNGESNYKTLTNIDFQAGALGPYYYPVNGGNLSLLLNAGNRTAKSLGLYHYTVTTNEVAEGTNVVSIGYHYIATDTNGNPLSTPGDGTPDYIADANGNGIDDPGETPWDIAILSQPQSTNVAQGQGASFSVVASGIGPFTYQWLQNGGKISNANSSSYPILVTQPSQDGYAYSVIVSNTDGSVTSSIAILHVTTPFAITGGPSSATVAQGATTNFSVATTGNYLVYQWYSNSVPLNNSNRFSGATTSNLTISGVLPSDAAGYSVVVTNLFGSLTGGPVSLIVVTNPWISSSSMTTNAIQSLDAPFSVAANGAQFYQWWFSNSIVNTNIPGASGPNYTNYTQLVVQTNNAGFYSVIITNLAGSTNVGANMTVLVPPWINSQPAAIVTNQGSNVTFSVTATGTTNLYYQWFNNGTNIAGATNSSFTLSNVQPTNAAGYSCLVSNIAGTNMSAWAWLSVILPGGGSTNYGWGTNGNTAFIPPVVSMLSPTNSSPTNPRVYSYGTPISIRANASSQYSYITNVAFYFTGTNSGAGTNFMLAGTAVPGPNTQFALAWTNMLPGTNILEARAWDYNGNVTNSGLVYVIMKVPPSISAGPNTNVVWTEGASGTNIILSGSITNDGQPYSYVTNIQWSVVSGNGAYATNSTPNSLTAHYTFT